MSLREVLPERVHRSSPRSAGRGSTHRLEKIATRLEVLEGYLAVYLNLDESIGIIRTEDEPKPKLIKAFSLTEMQSGSYPQHAPPLPAQAGRDGESARSTSLTAEQKDIKKLLGSPRVKSERLIEEVKAIDAKFGQKTALGKRRTEIAEAGLVAKVEAMADEVATLENAVEEGADHRSLFREGLAAGVRGPSRGRVTR